MKWAFSLIFGAAFFHSAYCQRVTSIKITDLEKRISHPDTTYIVNFWATWCVPCVKELPAFDSIHSTFKEKNIKVLLVSLDFKEDMESKLLPFIASKKVKSEVVLLDETDANYFIPKISNDWTGAIPATLIKGNPKNYKIFFEKKVNYEFLKTKIENIQ